MDVGAHERPNPISHVLNDILGVTALQHRYLWCRN
jgi:hypothetical protein